MQSRQDARQISHRSPASSLMLLLIFFQALREREAYEQLVLPESIARQTNVVSK
jgi:hypothetical protein